MPTDGGAIVEVMGHLGGVATRGQLLGVVTRTDLARAVERGDVVRLARGRYAAASVDDARKVAATHAAVLCSVSAALHHGWAVKTVPDRPHLQLNRGRRPLPPGVATVHWGRLTTDEAEDG